MVVFVRELLEVLHEVDVHCGLYYISELNIRKVELEHMVVHEKARVIRELPRQGIDVIPLKAELLSLVEVAGNDLVANPEHPIGPPFVHRNNVGVREHEGLDLWLEEVFN